MADELADPPADRWAIYYDTGLIWTDKDGPWAEAPADGVLFCIVQRGDRIETLSGNDYYCLDGGTIFATGDLGPLLRKLGIIKFGRHTSVRRYEAVGRKVAEDANTWARTPLP